MADLLIAANPDPDSKLPYLMRLPQPGGDLLFRTSGTWPRVKALYCHPMPLVDGEPIVAARQRPPVLPAPWGAIDVIVDRPSRSCASNPTWCRA